VAVALLIAKKKGVAPLVEEDERTEQVNARAGYLTFLAALGFSFVGWVTETCCGTAEANRSPSFRPGA
jgi:hypothetical protein